jgi:cytochrome bd-type quinol oxidase subunit 2
MGMDSNNNYNNNPWNNNQDNDNYFYNNYNYNRMHDPAEKHVIMASHAQMAGLLSLPLAITGVFGFIASGIGILFALLSKGTQEKLLPQARKGIMYGTIGLVCNIALMGYMMYPVITHPTEYMTIVNEYYDGDMTTVEFMEELSELLNSK